MQHCSKLGGKALQNGVYIKLHDQLDPTKEPLIVQGVVQAKEPVKKDEEDEEVSVHSSVENVRAESVLPGEEEVLVVSRGVDLSSLLGIREEEGEEGAKCVLIRAQVSSNGIDFSEPGPESMLCHKFAPAGLHPVCGTFEGQREVVVTGSGLIPSDLLQMEAVHTLVIDSEEGEDGKVELEASVPVRCTQWNELSYTVPSVRDFFTGESFPVPNKNVLEVDVHFRLAMGEYLSVNTFTFQYYKTARVEVYPDVIRRSGGTKLSISGQGVHFYSETAKVLIVDKVADTVTTFGYDEFSELNGEGKGWTIACTAPSLLPGANTPHKMESKDDGVVERGHTPRGVGMAYLGLLLDGTSQPPDSKLSPLHVFEELCIQKESFPKGPSLMNANLTLAVTGLVPSSICVVRIRNQDGEFVETTGTIAMDTETISFVIPDTIPQLLPPGTTKNTSSYFVDICIDGSTFDNMEDALLQIKI